MNNARRKTIEELSNKLDNLHSELIDVLNEEEETFYNIPESLQYSDRGMTSQDAQDKLNEAIDSIGEAIEILNEII